ncbi:Rho GDP-dissociation inhibitor [Ceratobasidium theobromae]|uniref:Rho GDP-dissociation inhibitor n=1 Tax=Ceratobasidium theobromae TaxID=1582974 RepID=A0A5N5QQ84_9AGAM|nr:Rho GDP-dissociation inhibitor [Ceratobasidium theobromae]
MSAPHEEDDLNPTQTAGYKVGAKKTVAEYANLDAEDESLARWKASLGIAGGDQGGGSSQPAKFIVHSLFLTSPTREGDIVLNPNDPSTKNETITIKEGVEYSVGMTFTIENDVISGLRYLHVVKRAGIPVEKMEKMIGSYGPKDKPHEAKFLTEESPSGFMARSGSYEVRSKIIDDDGVTRADFKWCFKIGKEW